jgi:hypothetical protein
MTIEVRSRFGDFVPVLFRVDTGADVTTIPVPVAEEKGLGFTREHAGSATGIVGTVRKYAGSLHVRIAGMEYHWPCDFTERPTAVEGRVGVTGQPLTSLSPVLGRAGLLDDFAVAVDSDYLIVTRLGPMRRWWRRRWRRIRLALRPAHDPDEPL